MVTTYALDAGVRCGSVRAHQVAAMTAIAGASPASPPGGAGLCRGGSTTTVNTVTTLDWKTDSRLAIGDTEFVLAPTDPNTGRVPGTLTLRKPRWMVERYLALRDLEPANVVELGIYEGGGTAFLSLLFQPQMLVAIDLTAERVPDLDRFIKRTGLSVHPYFGVDQADREHVEDIVERHFGSEPLDLVVDDASHLLEPTISSFNLLFPRLRPGGLFVIEDWSWQHFQDTAIAAKMLNDPGTGERLARRLEGKQIVRSHPLSRLVLQLVLTCGYAEAVVADISVRRGWTVIRRGDAVLGPDFDVTTSYGTLGRSLLPAEPQSS